MTTREITIYDPPMCCSTGVCGPEVDPKLVRFTADLDWVAARGVTVRRYNLAQEPGAFIDDAAVKAVLERSGEAGLPVIKLDGVVMGEGAYPSRDELARWVGLGTEAPSIFTEAVTELVAIGAAIASNCEPCFKFHYDKARKLGVSREDMQRAVDVAQAVKDTPARAVLALADRYLSRASASSADAPSAAAATTPSAPAPAPAKASGCCGPIKVTTPAATKSGSCC